MDGFMKYALLYLTLLPVIAVAEVPHKFVTGTAAKAAQVNENFAHTEAKADANKTLIDTLQSSFTGQENSLTTLQTSVETLQTTQTSQATSITDLLAQAKANFDSIVTFGNSVQANTTAISDNASNIAANTTSIEDLTTKASDNAASVLANQTSIESLSSTQTTLVSDLESAIEDIATRAKQAELDSALDKIATLESTAQPSPLNKLQSGQITVNVDCTDNSKALIEAFHQHLIYTNVGFEITGRCEGDIQNVPNDEDNEQGSAIIGSQVISIYSQDPASRATIINNEETNRSSLFSGLGGGLYLSDIDIESSSDNNFALVFFGSNSHGRVTNVQISGNSRFGIVLQEGAQAYVQETTVNDGASIGLMVKSGGVLRLIGNNSFRGAEHAVVARVGSSVNQQGDLTAVGGSESAITIRSGSIWQSYNSITATGKVAVENNASLELMNIDITGDLHINSSDISIFNTANVSGEVNLWQANLNAQYLNANSFITFQSNFNIWKTVDITTDVGISGGSNGLLTGLATAKITQYDSHLGINRGEREDAHVQSIEIYRSQMTIDGVGFGNINSGLSSLIEINNAVGEEIRGFQNSQITLGNSDVTDNIHLNSSMLSVYGAGLTVENGIELHHSRADAENSTPPSKFQCNGLSSLNISDWDKIDFSTDPATIDNSTNCADESVWSSLIQHHLSSNF